MVVQKVPTVSCAPKSLHRSFSHCPIPSFSSPSSAALLHRDLRLHRQRGLHQPPQRGGGVLHLQPQPERLQLWRLHGLHGLPLLHGLPGSGRVLPPDQQRQRPQEGGAG